MAEALGTSAHRSEPFADAALNKIAPVGCWRVARPSDPGRLVAGEVTAGPVFKTGTGMERQTRLAALPLVPPLSTEHAGRSPPPCGDQLAENPFDRSCPPIGPSSFLPLPPHLAGSAWKSGCF